MKYVTRLLMITAVTLTAVSCTKKSSSSATSNAAAPQENPGQVTLSQEEYNYLVSLMGDKAVQGMSVEAMLDVLASSIANNPAIADKIRGPLTAKLEALK